MCERHARHYLLHRVCLPPQSPYCALPLGPWPPSTTPVTSPAALPFPCLGLGAVAFYYPYWYAYVTCVHGGVVPACLPPWPTRRCPLSDLLISASATLVHFTPLGMATVGVPM